MIPPTLDQRARGLLLGLAVGDAVGLPAEGLSRRRVRRMFARPWRHRFVFGRGMVSDDTEHAWFVTQSLLAHPADAAAFARRLAWCLRGWLLGLPAGIGFATLRACLKLWLGFGPRHSGVYSAGNGPAMRVAPVGLRFAHDAARREAYVAASTRLTHTDPKAFTGAKAVADLVAWCVREDLAERPATETLLACLRAAGPDDAAWQEQMDALEKALEASLGVAGFAARLGLEHGVSGYIYHTVPVAVYAWYVHWGDFEETLSAVWECGGDTDTCGAIAGALAGTLSGDAGIPATWRKGLWEWPRSVRHLEEAGRRLSVSTENGSQQAPVAYFWPGLCGRNPVFMSLVLSHGLRRLLPPY